MEALNIQISIFETFDSEPVGYTLAKWVALCRKKCRYTKQVLQYRRSGEQHLKKSLPLATVGAVCNGGRKLENVEIRTGWIALDIDGKDNLHIKDAEALRDELKKISFVAFAGLSVSGKGVWALVKVSNPKKQAEHFEQLKTDFKSIGVTLDGSKGKNPNDARFYSYDPDSWINEDFKIYNRLPVKRPDRPTSIQPINANKYSEAAFTDELKILSEAQKGNRNNQLFKSSASLASLVAGGMLNKYEVQQALKETARSLGLKDFEINATVSSGFEHGFSNPRTVDSIRTNTIRQSHEQWRDKPLESKIESGKFPTSQKIRGNSDKPDKVENEAPESGIREDAQTEYEAALSKDPILREIDRIFEPEIIN